MGIGLGSPECVLVLDDQRAVVADLEQRGDVAGPVDHAESRNAKAISALADAATFGTNDAVVVLGLGQKLGVLGVGVVDAGAEVTNGTQVVDAQPDQVGRVRTKAKGRVGDGVENRGPVCRSISQVTAAVGPVFHDEANADSIRMIDDRSDTLREETDVLVKTQTRRHFVAKPDVGDVLGGGVVEGTASLDYFLGAQFGVGRNWLAGHADGRGGLKAVAVTDGSHVGFEEGDVNGLVAVGRAPADEFLKFDRREVAVVEVTELHCTLALARWPTIVGSVGVDVHAGIPRMERDAPTSLLERNLCADAVPSHAERASMRRAPAWLKVVAAAHSAQARTRAEPGVAVHRITGGANNALYCVTVGGEHFACKLCVNDGRERAKREYGALRILEATGLDVAPQPLWLDESCTVVSYPTVAYQWMSGSPLGPELTSQQLTALIESLQHIHGVRPGDLAGYELADAWFHWFDFEPYLDELHGLLAEHGPWLIHAERRGRELYARLGRLVEGCAQVVARSDADPHRAQVPQRLCRVDPGLANALWCDDGRLRWVDWEYSGWGDPALELADLRWHVSLEELSPAEHDRLRDGYLRPAGDVGFEKRLAVWDRLISTRWACLILRWLRSAHEGPDRERLTQPTADVVTLCARLLRFIERAEEAVLEAR